MKKIQVIGLPGSGKTTGINNYLKVSTIDVQHVDVSNFRGTYRDQVFWNKVMSAPTNVIAESACGVRSPGFVIKLLVPVSKVYAQLLARDQELDENYLSLLSTQMIRADYTIGRSEDLPDLLQAVLEGRC